MRGLKFSVLVFVLILINIFEIQVLSSDSPNNIITKTMFEQKYSAWKKELKTSKDFLADPSGYDLKSYDGITALGIFGLPFIIPKLQEDPILYLAAKKISKRTWYGGEDKRSAYERFSTWWAAGQKQVRKDFDFIYSEWEKIKTVGKEAEIAKALKRFEDLGIAALPYMFEKIAFGETEFIRIVSKLTDGALKTNVSIIDCQEWWKKIKNQWLIPFPDQNLWDK